MKTMTYLLASLIAIVPGFCQTLTQGERDRALSELYASRKVFLDSVAGVTDAQWNFKPAPDVWSIAECAEHIAVSEDQLMGFVHKLMESPAEPDKRALAKGKDEAVLKGAADRSHKAKAPEFLVPTHRWPTPAALIAHFTESRGHTLDYVRTTGDPLRVHFMDHPVFKVMDAYQLVLLISAHTERHTAQLNEVKRNPSYPK